MKNSTFTGGAALRCCHANTLIRHPWVAAVPVRSSPAPDAAPRPRLRRYPGSPERSPDSRAGLWAASAGGEAASPQRLPKPSIAHKAPALAWAHGGTTWRHDPARDLFILDQFFLHTAPVRERQRGPGAPHRSKSRGGAPAAPLPERVPGAERGERRGRPGSPRAAPARPHAHGPPPGWVSGAPDWAAPPLPAGRGSPRCRRRGCRCSARRPWPQTRRDGDVARRAAPARRRAGPTAAARGHGRALPSAAPWRPSGAAPCAGRGHRRRHTEELINLLALAAWIRYGRCVHRT